MTDPADTFYGPCVDCGQRINLGDHIEHRLVGFAHAGCLLCRECAQPRDLLVVPHATGNCHGCGRQAEALYRLVQMDLFGGAA